MQGGLDRIEPYLTTLPEPATWERVREGFWYVRIPGTARSWIPIELDASVRTLGVTSHFCIPPEENEARAYAYLLRSNHRASGLAFSADAEGVICIVGRVPLDELDDERLDAVVGGVVDLTERTFRSYLRIGFASRFR